MWLLLCKYSSGYWQLSELFNGAYTGLAAITAGSGFVDARAAVIIAACAAPCGFLWVRYVKPRMGLDDALDVAALQGVPGIVGSLLLGVFAPNVGGLHQVGLQGRARFMVSS